MCIRKHTLFNCESCCENIDTHARTHARMQAGRQNTYYVKTFIVYWYGIKSLLNVFSQAIMHDVVYRLLVRHPGPRIRLNTINVLRDSIKMCHRAHTHADITLLHKVWTTTVSPCDVCLRNDANGSGKGCVCNGIYWWFLSGFIHARTDKRQRALVI